MTNEEIKSLVASRIEGQGNQVDASSVLPKILNRIVDKVSDVGASFLSLERLKKYLYRITFDSLPKDNGRDNVLIGGCSSFVRDGKLYRNLDFYYDETASFIVRTRDFEGMSFITGLNDGELVEEKINQLPYRVVDGRNNNGIMVSTHILYNDWDWKGSGRKDILLTRLPYFVLTHAKSMETLGEDLGDILDNLVVTSDMGQYLIQVLVTDGITTYAILPPTEENQPYVLQDITENPKLSNFRWVASPIVTRGELHKRPNGVERFNLMPCELSTLAFTKAYETPEWLSEFIGLGETTKDSTDEELLAIYEMAHGLYERRKRDGVLWHTMHSVIYGDKMESLHVQEDWSDDCLGDYNSRLMIGNLADLDTDHKSTIVEAINEIADLVETPHFVISFQKSSAELKAVYDECKANLVLAKNIVFYNVNTNLYYCVNGYNMVNNILKLHAIIGEVNTVINLSPNGTLSIG